MATFSLNHFQEMIGKVTDAIGDRPLNQDLEDLLNITFPPNSDVFKAIKKACETGISTGALCQYQAEGIKYGRAIKACDALQYYSVDLVQMIDVVGPHHRHPKGEIDMVMPICETAKFDERGAGWMVYGPGSAHRPTVTEGEALVLYLLPNGEIEFTGA